MRGMARWLVLLLITACSQGQSERPSPSVDLAMTCLRFAHDSLTDIIFLDTLPPSFTPWRTDNMSRVIVYPFFSDTLPRAQRALELRFVWRQAGKHVWFEWGGAPIEGEVSARHFVGRVMFYSGVISIDTQTGRQTPAIPQGPYNFERITCPHGWVAAS
jgi:hypothetical protein